jgi:hypothetical protein
MRALAIPILLWMALFPAIAFGIEVSGDVWGTWSPVNNPYEVVGELRVPPESTLVIEPGVFVDFQGHYKFIVDSLATLLAIGTETDSIYFTTDDTATGWHGIRLHYADSSSQVSYCHIEYGRAIGPSREAAGGAIFCYYSGLTITHNTITHNYAARHGGAIWCNHSSVLISDNVISENWSDYVCGGIDCIDCDVELLNNRIVENEVYWGDVGGILCSYCNATITGNTISRNCAYWGWEGGLSCGLSTVTITGNTITGNYGDYGGGITLGDCGGTVTDNLISGNSAFTCTEGAGGGIYCSGPSPSFKNNVISGNQSFYGGAIYLIESSPLFDHCLITGNAAESLGAAIYCVEASPTLVNNTISRNVAWEGQAGGIYAEASNLTIFNTILWADSARQQPYEIYLDQNSTLDITYSDIQGGWPGQGNIDANPLFVGPEKRDFYLRWRSPCIDAGSPDSLDPDGTASDIGALYFNQNVLGIVELYPHDTPIVIPPEGGDLIYDGWLFNFLCQPGRADIWTYAFVPEMGRYGPLTLYENVRIPADSIGMNEITQHVPGVAPQGDYVFVAYVGDYPSTIIDSSCFYFTKTGSVAGGIADWQSLKRWFDGALASTGSGLPTHYALSQNYPNPFNATTIINYQLPVDAYVKLEIFNLFGERLATLVDCRQQGGDRSAIWDASKFSSGIYFYRLTTGQYKFTRNMALSK